MYSIEKAQLEENIMCMYTSNKSVYHKTTTIEGEEWNPFIMADHLWNMVDSLCDRW